MVLWDGFNREPPTAPEAAVWAETTGVNLTLPVLVDHETVFGEVAGDWKGTNHFRVVLSPEMEILDSHISLEEREEARVFEVVMEHAGQ